MKAIVVPVADRPECAIALTTAFDLAERFSGNVVGYHLRPHRKETKSSAKNTINPINQYVDWRGNTSQKQIELDSKNAKRLFDRLTTQYEFKSASRARYSKQGGLAIWHKVTGDPAHLFAIIGPMSDLIVVSRPKNKRSLKARAFATAALLHGGSPVLLVPQRKVASIGNNIVIAWNQSEQAAAAVNAAMPMLVNAESVTIVSALHNNHLGPGVNHVQQYLKLHGVKVDVIKTPGISPENEIVQAYSDANADLLVMGAYSRPRWREQVFGGVTQHMLDKTQIPVLIMHC